MQRYSITKFSNNLMRESKKGEWVKWEDVKEIIKRSERNITLHANTENAHTGVVIHNITKD